METSQLKRVSTAENGVQNGTKGVNSRTLKNCATSELSVLSHGTTPNSSSHVVFSSGVSPRRETISQINQHNVIQDSNNAQNGRRRHSNPNAPPVHTHKTDCAENSHDGDRKLSNVGVAQDGNPSTTTELSAESEQHHHHHHEGDSQRPNTNHHHHHHHHHNEESTDNNHHHHHHTDSGVAASENTHIDPGTHHHEHTRVGKLPPIINTQPIHSHDAPDNRHKHTPSHTHHTHNDSYSVENEASQSNHVRQIPSSSSNNTYRLEKPELKSVNSDLALWPTHEEAEAAIADAFENLPVNSETALKEEHEMELLQSELEEIKRLQLEAKRQDAEERQQLWIDCVESLRNGCGYVGQTLVSGCRYGVRVYVLDLEDEDEHPEEKEEKEHDLAWHRKRRARGSCGSCACTVM